MDVTPYREDAVELIRATHEQRVTCTLTRGATSYAGVLLSGSLTLAEDWSPFAQFSGTIANTFTTADLAQLDPREPLTVQVAAGYVHPDGTEDVHTIFTGQLEERRLRNPEAVVDVKASSAELFAHENDWLGADTFKTFTGVREAVDYFASYATNSTIVCSAHIPYNYRPADVTGIPLETGDNLWQVLDDIATKANVRLFVDTDGTWRIAAKAAVAGVTNAFLTTGGGGLVEKSQDYLSRDDYAAAAAVTYKWKDAGGVDRTVRGTYGTNGKKSLTVERKWAATQTQANDAAKSIVRMMSTRGNGYSLEAVATYWLRPGMTVQVTLANGTEARHIVKSVTFNLLAGTMRVETREPSNIT